MNIALKQQILKYFKQLYGSLEYDEVTTVTELVERTSATNVAISSYGVEYDKDAAVEYLRSQNMQINTQNLNNVSKRFEISNMNPEDIIIGEDGKEYVQKTREEVKKVNLETMMESDDDLRDYMLFEILKEKSKSSNTKEKYKYIVKTIVDDSKGSTNINALERVLEEYGDRGYRVVSIFTNELGVNSHVEQEMFNTVRVNATIDQVVIIFEKKWH